MSINAISRNTFDGLLLKYIAVPSKILTNITILPFCKAIPKTGQENKINTVTSIYSSKETKSRYLLTEYKRKKEINIYNIQTNSILLLVSLYTSQFNLSDTKTGFNFHKK